MKKVYHIVFTLFPIFLWGQNVITNDQSYLPQQLIEDILIDSNCISNVIVTNTVSGNFGNSEKSFGFFDASGTNFPFQTGIVLSTGKLINVQGPNTTLSDDDATNWIGDDDLEQAVNETGTINATIIEFDFTSIADQISFRYIFASEEYQENNASTCNFSDLFGFLIREVGTQNYQNIALIPGTNTPVKVTTVHPDIPSGCDAENELYFESFNDATAPINFNGQTKVLTATANTVPNQNYHVKLVIADEQNARYDSAVFLEAGSFKLTTDLGPDRLLGNLTSLCGNETLAVDASQSNALSYQWFKDGINLTGETNAQYTITNPGIYSVNVVLDNGCISEGEIVIEYAPSPVVNNTNLLQCDENQDGFTWYNLYDSSDQIITDPNDSIFDFYTSFANAASLSEPIETPNNYNNTSVNQIIYALIGNQNTRCKAIAEITLMTSNNSLNIAPINICEDTIIDGLATFNLNEVSALIQDQIPINATLSFYTNEIDALASNNSLGLNYTSTTPYTEIIYVKVTSETNDCFALNQVTLNVLERPEVQRDYNVPYCTTNFPSTITIVGQTISPQASYTYSWTYNSTPLNETSAFLEINQIGTYTFTVTNSNNCSATQTITVSAIETPIISTVIDTELSNNNTVTIETSNSGDFEYAIDNPSLIYQSSNTFNAITAGFHTVYVREKNGCGLDSKEIYILGLPSFFSPNNDGFNDVWKPKGVSNKFNNDLIIKIFNRYGKLLAQVNPILGWDGRFNNKALPTNDYWYTITKKDGTIITGHFSLKR